MILIQIYLSEIVRIKEGAYVINIDEFIIKSIGTYWIALHGNHATYFDNFGISHIPKGNLKKS